MMEDSSNKSHAPRVGPSGTNTGEKRPEDSDSEPRTEMDETGELVTFLNDEAGLPADFWACAALLESQGLRDVDAEKLYQRPSIFHLARDLFPLVRSRSFENPSIQERPASLKAWRRVLRFVRFYVKGSMFALPMVGQIGAVLVLRYSLWAWLEFDAHAATLVAMGTIASFFVSGPLVQAIGRQGTFYQGQENYILLRRATFRLIASGLVLELIVALLFGLTNLLIPFFSLSEVGVVSLYFLLLSFLWLLLAACYMLRDFGTILFITLLGTAVVHLVMQKTSWGITAAHGLGLATANLLAVSWVILRLSLKTRKADKKYQLAKLPRPSVFFYTLEPFLLYGFLYFIFLFVDRLVAWSCPDGPLPLVIWFRVPYELGMDWALVSLVLTIAMLEYTINEFSASLIPEEQHSAGRDHKLFRRRYQRFYKRQMFLLLITALVSITITYFGIGSLRRLSHVKEVHDFFASPKTFFVFWGAAVGYSLLAAGLLNGLFFFSLFRPWVVVRTMARALAANILVGFLASRLISYEYAVIGLVAGSGLFAFEMGRKALTLFEELDAVYYSAY